MQGVRLRDARIVARRVQALAVLVERSEQRRHLCLSGEPLNKTWGECLAPILAGELKDSGALPWISEREKQMLLSSGSSWQDDDRVTGSWLSEGLGALQWCLGYRSEWPAIDELVSYAEVMSSLPETLGTQSFPEQAALRGGEIIGRSYRESELWLWRAQVDRAEAEGQEPPETWTWPKLIRVTLELANKENLMPPPCDDDFMCYGQPFRKIGADERAWVFSAALERKNALGWVLDGESSVP